MFHAIIGDKSNIVGFLAKIVDKRVVARLVGDEGGVVTGFVESGANSFVSINCAVEIFDGSSRQDEWYGFVSGVALCDGFGVNYEIITSGEARVGGAVVAHQLPIICTGRFADDKYIDFASAGRMSIN